MIMKRMLLFSLLVSAGLWSIKVGNFLYAQGLTLEQIKTNLLANPPNTGDPIVREETITALDNILKHDSSRTAQSVIDFYTFMMEKVKTELKDTVSAETSIWMMYNHGFVVKTPQIVVGFDLVNGYTGWSTALPRELVDQIQVLFVSHRHLDHYDREVVDIVIANGGSVVVPAEDSYMGNVPMAAGDSLVLGGLDIRAHAGLHSAAVRIYEVATPSGLKILHTGDNQTSETLPEVSNPDVLLLNAWVNESGLTTAVIGMRNCIDKLKPRVMLPGHIQELYHDPARRARYEWAFEVDDESLDTEVQVMAWGERYFVPEELVGTGEHTDEISVPNTLVLHQNYPNPFNPSTTIRYELPRRSQVILKIFNLLGQEVATLVNEQKGAGRYQARWDASRFSSSIYFYRLNAGEFVETKKLILLR